MTPADWRRTQCDGKFAFPTWADAERVRKDRARGRRGSDCRQVYRCTYCHKFHLGQSAPGRKRDKRT